MSTYEPCKEFLAEMVRDSGFLFVFTKEYINVTVIKLLTGQGSRVAQRRHVMGLKPQGSNSFGCSVVQSTHGQWCTHSQPHFLLFGFIGKNRFKDRVYVQVLILSVKSDHSRSDFRQLRWR